MLHPKKSTRPRLPRVIENHIKILEEIKTQNVKLSIQKEELEASYEKIIELDRFKESMSGMIVHDLKNLLNIVIHLSSSTITEFKQKSIHQSGLEMLNMVSNILDIYKYENAEIPLERTDFNASKLLRYVNCT